jgi:peptide/nickel transport system substrate-binding protein
MSHRSLIRSLPHALIALLVVLLLAACTTVQPAAAPADAGAGAAPVEPKSGGVLIAARGADAKGLDPHVQTAFSSFRALEHIYEPLLRLDADMNVAPGLAESWAWSEDGKTLTMALRQGVTFHDGTPMTSADVKFTFERLLNEETGAAARSFFTAIEVIDTPDDNTVVFTLSAPNAAILAAMTNPNSGIMSKAWIEGGADPTTATNGTGPFKLASWEPDNIMMLDANRAYWEAGVPLLDGIEFRTIPDEASILAALRSGEVDWALINDPRVGMTAATTDLTLMRSPALAYHVLQLNAKRPMFEDQRVRLALSCAINRQQVLDTASLGEGEVTSPATPPNYRAPLDQLECYTQDVERAKQLLTDADVSGVEFTAIAAADEPPTALSEAQNIQAQLEAIGVTMNIETLELGVYVDRWLKGDFDAAIASTAAIPTRTTCSIRYWHSTGNLNGVANYSSPEIDALLEEARSTTDVAKRQELYLEIQKLLAEAAPWVWLYVGYEYRAMQPDVMGYTPLSNGSTVYLRETYLNR